MSDDGAGRPPGQGDRGTWPFDPIRGQTVPGPTATDAAASPAPEAASPAPGAAQPVWRRLPVWVLVIAGLALIGIVVAAVLLLRPDPAPQEPVAQEVPEDVLVTLPPPTPTIEPIPREAGTAFFDALPSTVLSYAVTETGEHPPLLASGALEAYRFVYSDGGSATLTLYAGQWATPEAADAVLQQVMAAEAAAAEAAPAEGDSTEGDSTEGETAEGDTAEGEAGEDASGGEEPALEDAPTEPEQGPVMVDGQQVGTYLLTPRADGTASVVWTNGTVVLQIDGPAQTLPDVFAAFPL